MRRCPARIGEFSVRSTEFTEQSREVTAGILPRVGEEIAGFSFDHGLGERRGVYRQHGRAASLGLDHVEAECFLFRQSGEQKIQLRINRVHVVLVSPPAHLVGDGVEAFAQVAYRSVAAAAEDFQIDVRELPDDRGEDAEHQRKLLDRR